jgi:hypothetical protein
MTGTAVIVHVVVAPLEHGGVGVRVRVVAIAFNGRPGDVVAFPSARSSVTVSIAVAVIVEVLAVARTLGVLGIGESIAVFVDVTGVAHLCRIGVDCSVVVVAVECVPNDTHIELAGPNGRIRVAESIEVGVDICVDRVGQRWICSTSQAVAVLVDVMGIAHFVGKGIDVRVVVVAVAVLGNIATGYRTNGRWVPGSIAIGIVVTEDVEEQALVHLLVAVVVEPIAHLFGAREDGRIGIVAVVVDAEAISIAVVDRVRAIDLTGLLIRASDEPEEHADDVGHVYTP